MTQQTKILITGGSGYLGRHIVKKAVETYTVATTYATKPLQLNKATTHQLDITDQNQVDALVTTISPQAIIHSVAATPGCDENTMMQINATGTRYVAEAAVKIGALLVHVSTDALHDGTQPLYSDDTAPTPTTVYGHSKAEAEYWVQEVDPQAAIVRTSLIYGLADMDRGTLGFVKRLESGEPLILFRDVYRQPVWTETLVTALLKLAVDIPDWAGILNVVGRQLIDRETFGRLMLDWWQVEGQHQIKSGLGADLPHPPPLKIKLSVDKAETLLGMTFWGVEDVLAQAKAKKKTS